MPPPRRKRIAISVRIDRDLAARFRAFVRDHAGKPLYLTVSDFVEQAIETHLAKLQREVEVADRGPIAGLLNPNHRKTRQ